MDVDRTIREVLYGKKTACINCGSHDTTKQDADGHHYECNNGMCPDSTNNFTLPDSE